MQDICFLQEQFAQYTLKIVEKCASILWLWDYTSKYRFNHFNETMHPMQTRVPMILSTSFSLTRCATATRSSTSACAATATSPSSARRWGQRQRPWHTSEAMTQSSIKYIYNILQHVFKHQTRLPCWGQRRCGWLQDSDGLPFTPLRQWTDLILYRQAWIKKKLLKNWM